MPNTLSLIQKAHSKRSDETGLQYLDRVRECAFWQLNGKKKRTKEEEREHTELLDKRIGKTLLASSSLPCCFADNTIQAVDRLYEELVDEYKADTCAKRLLIQRLVCAYSMSLMYERMLSRAGYRSTESGFHFHYEMAKTGYLREARKGLESANDQIIRLSQALENLARPSIQVKTTNAFFAQNQQINQQQAPHLLEDHEKATR